MQVVDIWVELGSEIQINADLKAFHPSWPVEKIIQKTGVSVRHTLGSNDSFLELVLRALNRAFPRGIDNSIRYGLIVATQSGPWRAPGIASLAHSHLAFPIDTFVMDVNSACSGFVQGLALSNSLLESLTVDEVVLVCADAYSQYIDKNDRSVLPLFSDAASVIRLRKSAELKIFHSNSGTDGSASGAIRIGQNRDTSGRELFEMNGREVFLKVLQCVPLSIRALIDKSEINEFRFKYFLFHQASKITLDELISKLEISSEKVPTCLDKFGNLGSSSIPFLLMDLIKKDLLNSGDIILMSGFGIGFSWANCILEW
jgi:3-oxoacyl-[acyl-carrier-protein] synthase-3